MKRKALIFFLCLGILGTLWGNAVFAISERAEGMKAVLDDIDVVYATQGLKSVIDYGSRIFRQGKFYYRITIYHDNNKANIILRQYQTEEDAKAEVNILNEDLRSLGSMKLI